MADTSVNEGNFKSEDVSDENGHANGYGPVHVSSTKQKQTFSVAIANEPEHRKKVS